MFYKKHNNHIISLLVHKICLGASTVCKNDPMISISGKGVNYILL